MHLNRSVITVIMAFLLAFLGACGQKDTKVTKPNIILISIEATRPDHISGYGYERPTSPFIDSLAEEGVRFENAYSVSSWTVPSVASLVTGTYPAMHGVVHGIFQNKKRVIQGQELLSADLPHLARYLQEDGYTTFGVTANGHLAKQLGYGEGFDYYQNIDFKKGSDLAAPNVNNLIGQWTDQMGAADPYFLWIHYFDPHTFYNPRKPWIDDYFPEFNANPEKFKKFSRDRAVAFVRKMKVKKDTEEFECIKALYDSEINMTDEAIRTILKSLNVDDDDLIIITSDHGEEFLDHGSFGHSSSLHDEQIRVPLVFRLPGARSRSVVQETPVSIVDVAPTILDYLHLEIPADMQGRSLMSLMNGRPGSVHEGIWTTLERTPSSQSSLIVGDWKIIVKNGRGGNAHLFDLSTDPQELQNLARKYPKKVAELKKMLVEMNRTYGSDREVELNTEGLTEDEIKKLRSMGYVH